MIPPMTFKFWQEVGWTVVIAAGLAILTALATVDPEAITDWRVWAIGLGGNVLRAAATAAIAGLRRSSEAA